MSTTYTIWVRGLNSTEPRYSYATLDAAVADVPRLQQLARRHGGYDERPDWIEARETVNGPTARTTRYGLNGTPLISGNNKATSALTASQVCRQMREFIASRRKVAEQIGSLMVSFSETDVLRVRQATVPNETRAALTDGTVLVMTCGAVYRLGGSGPGWSRPCTDEEIESLPDTMGDQFIWPLDGPAWFGRP